jgi:hypothetical protein
MQEELEMTDELEHTIDQLMNITKARGIFIAYLELAGLAQYIKDFTAELEEEN